MKFKGKVGGCHYCGNTKRLADPKWLKEARKQLGWSLRAVAKQVGISAQYIHHCEQGRGRAAEKLIRFYEKVA